MSNHVIPSIILCKKDLLSLMGLWIQLNRVKWFEEGVGGLYQHGMSARRFMATVLDRKNV